MFSQVQLATTTQKISNPYTRSFRVVEGTLPQAIARPAWGVDPGVNFGVTLLDGRQAFVFSGSLLKEDEPGCYGRMAYSFLDALLDKYFRDGASLVVEGASYGDQFGQVLLSEVRTGFYLAAVHHPGVDSVEITPPKTVRKKVFGDGKIKAPDEWPLLNRNAADSLAIALYAAQVAE